MVSSDEIKRVPYPVTLSQNHLWNGSEANSPLSREHSSLWDYDDH